MYDQLNNSFLVIREFSQNVSAVSFPILILILGIFLYFMLAENCSML